MKRNILIKIVISVMIGLSQLASAALLDNFESYNTGKVYEVASPPWLAIFSTTGNALIAETGGNKYGKIWGAGNGARGMCRPLGTLSIPNTNTSSTLHLRVRAEGTGEDASFGLSDNAASSSLAWGNFEIQIALGKGALMARNAGTVVDLMPISSGVWYDIWAVIDNSTDTYDLYAAVEGNTPQLLATDIVFRNSGAGSVTADLVTFHSYNNTNGTAIWMDDISIIDGVAPELLVLPSSPNPDGEILVPVTLSTLSWTGGLDADHPSQLDPNVIKYYVWTSEDNVAGDPNLVLQETQTITSWADPSGSYALGVPLQYERIYYWQIEQAMNTGSGNVGDPNNILSPVWTFTTVSQIPTDLVGPADIKVFPAQAARFTVTYTSASPVTDVTWYRASDDSLVASWPESTDITADNTSSTLTIQNTGAGDEDGYYCIVTSTPGGASDPSGTAQLFLKKKLAWYQFENNADDSAGTNDGTVVNKMDYVNGKVTTDGQALAADPNGTNLVTVPKATAYPRTGENNGLDQGTIACWIKCNPGEGGHIMTQYTGAAGTYTTAIQFYVDSANNRFTFQLRDEETDQVLLQGADVDDGEWHYVVGTISGPNANLYIDVVKTVSASSTNMGNYAAWEYDMPIMGIAGRAPASGSFKGILDDLVITNYAMTQEEVAEAYYGVTGELSCLNPNFDSAYYDFNDDCIVDLADFAFLASNWLTTGLYPN